MVASGLGIAALPKGAGLPIIRAMKLTWRPLADPWAQRQLKVGDSPGCGRDGRRAQGFPVLAFAECEGCLNDTQIDLAPLHPRLARMDTHYIQLQASQRPVAVALAGLKVLELGQLIAGPFAGKTLGEFGADVDQDRAARRRRPAAQLAPAQGRHLGLVAGAVAQQALDRARPAATGRPGHRAQADRRGRRADRELPPRHAGRLGPGLRALCCSSTRGLVMLRISGYGQTGPYRDLPGFGVDRRGDGRPAPPDRRAGPRAGALRRLHRRHAGRAARRDRRPDRRCTTARARRPGPGDRRRAVRGGVQRDGEPAARVQRLRRGARAGRQRAARHRAVQRLPLQRRRLRADRRQRRQHLQAA